MRTNKTVEINIDALVGPTHHFSGMGVGNLASMRHKYSTSSPKRAALEGLKKAKLLADLGIPQFLLPPPRRPRVDLLTAFGFRGSCEQQLQAAKAADWMILSSIYSSSFMWAANSATTTAAADSADQKLHLTPANLISSLHRFIEAGERESQLARMFGTLRNEVSIHPPLPSGVPLRDEGAANHMRLCVADSPLGINVFVHGDAASGPSESTRFLARHTRTASQCLARLHQLDEQRTFHLQQHPDAISAGVFHNDVIATSHEHLLVHHQRAFAPASHDQVLRLDAAFEATLGRPLQRLVVSEADLSLDDAVRSYLFNSQIVSPPKGPRMMLISPRQCQEIEAARTLIEGWIADPDNPIEAVEYIELRESMAGGGGPACLRLRVVLAEDQVAGFAPACRLDDSLYDRLLAAIESHYPERLQIDDLANIDLVQRSWQAADAVSNLLALG